MPNDGVSIVRALPPFISQAPTSPLLVSRQMMSSLPSPSRSPTDMICQPHGTVATIGYDVTPPPFMIQRPTSPVDRLRHRMSLLPSPLKSPVSTICHS